jgi:hypothetical protein
MRRTAIAATILTPILTLIALLPPVPAAADAAQPVVPSADSVGSGGSDGSAGSGDSTPHVLDGSVRAIAIVGSTAVIGGDFSEVSDASGRTLYQRDSLFAFDLPTGHVLDFAPQLDGPVYALAAGPSGSVYVGGAFTQVDGVAQRGLTQLAVPSGDRIAAFTATINSGDVRTLAWRAPWLYVGGTFTKIGGAYRAALARLRGDSGVADAAFDLGLAAPHLSRAKVEDLAVSPDGARVVVIGAIEQVAGQNRAQLAMIDTGVTPARMSGWYTDAYTQPCVAGFETYLRSVGFSPNGAYLVVVTTGRMADPRRTCDTAARFEANGAGLHRPTWINRASGGSLYSVSVTGATVYTGGAPGLTAIDPITGRAENQKPTRSPGVRALEVAPSGLLVGSDTELPGHHGRLGMLPLG